jgi:hypothetical protein
MRKSLFVLLLCAAALASQEATFSESAVWAPKPGDEEETWVDMRQCGAMRAQEMKRSSRSDAKGSAGAFEACVGEAMRKHGASEEAIAFNRATEGSALATRFVEVGKVDVMEAVNPFMANSNDQLFFVNGRPPAVSADAEGATSLSPFLVALEKNPQMKVIRKKYPNAFLLPHAEKQSLVATEEDAGQRFTVKFPILNGCHACPQVGEATIAYMFSQNGRFLAAELAAVSETVPGR